MSRMIWLALTLVLLTQGCGSPESTESTGTGDNSSDNADSDPADNSHDAAPEPDKGSGRPTAKLPDNLPEDIAIYPGSRCTAAGSSDGGIRQPPNTLIHLETADDIQAVRDYYSKRLAELEWTLEEGTAGENAMLWNKGERKLSVQLHELTTEPPVVDILLYFTRPEDGDSK